MEKRALITGITGQDGSYLADFLLAQGYEVHGLVRRTSTLVRSRIDHLYRDSEIYEKKLFLEYGNLEDWSTLFRILSKTQFDEIYHLAGQSHVGLSFEIPESTCEFTAMATLRFLELIRSLPHQPKVYHASSSEVFGDPKAVPQDEDTPFNPVTPYGCAKAFATQLVRVYRNSYNLFICNGIMFNHESPRRGENFASRKICRAAASIKLGLQKEVMLGDTTAQRDWGDSRDYVRGMWLAMQHEKPEDFVFATGKLHSVQEMIECAFGTVGLDWGKYVRLDPRLTRVAEPHNLVGNPSKAKRLLGWEPQTSFSDLISEMVRCELDALTNQTK